jgi:hypothetical protein
MSQRRKNMLLRTIWSMRAADFWQRENNACSILKWNLIRGG